MNDIISNKLELDSAASFGNIMLKKLHVQINREKKQ